MNHSFDIEIACKVGVNEAIILQHIGFWHQKNVGNDKNYYDGRYWSRMSISGFHETFSYLTAKEIAGALLRLQKGGFISTANYNKIGYDKTLWYGLTELGHSLLQLKCHFTKSKMDSTKSKIDDTKMSNRNVQKGKPIPDVITDIITDKEYVNKENPKKQNFEVWKDGILEDRMYVERATMAMRRQIPNCKIVTSDFPQLLSDFLNEIQLLENLPKNEDQFRKYFYYWLPNWLKKLESGKPKQSTQTGWQKPDTATDKDLAERAKRQRAIDRMLND